VVKQLYVHLFVWKKEEWTANAFQYCHSIIDVAVLMSKVENM